MVTILAQRWWNKTGILLEEGKSYKFSANGTWIDWDIKSTAIGYSDPRLKKWEKWRRKPDSNWFSVIGCIDKRKQTQFDIGKLIETDAQYTATASGILYCFANDAWVMYWNNKGSIELGVEELEGVI